MTDLLARADTVIANASGIEDWRPLFVTGLQTAFVVVFLIGLVVGLVWTWRR
jgi:hypothetical protein